MLLHRRFLIVLALLVIPTGVLSRGGGHGGSSSSSDSDSSSGSSGSYSDSDSSGSDDTSSTSSSSDGGTSCTDSHRLDFLDLQPYHYNQYNSDPRRGHASAYSEFDGVFFKGVANFTYIIEAPPPNITSLGYPSSSSIKCPVGEQSFRMLGVAWVAGKPPRPAGPKNPIAIGFKAWESNIRLSDIDYSYSVCDQVDLMRFGTTVDMIYSTYKNVSLDAMDAVDLKITQAPENSDMIQFEGVYDLKDWANSERNSREPEKYENSGLSDQMFYLPAGICSAGEKLGEVGMRWNGTFVKGSMTNETLQLNLSGTTIAEFEIDSMYESTYTKVNVTFEIAFTGTLDVANSTQVVLTGAASHNESLITFKRANSATIPGLSLHLALLSLLFCSTFFL
ncbi:hypothetical protein N7499_006828 [Penicillium canescens]|uniref:Uncharacterized protein n=1 Tax=Penicillium canescens TaxID=5083 RepID=A0AAD6N9J0_PENCN|nr:uncharacterized protein N7446_002518 [Penicillium canescens]KAJ5996859.1 hypothetical protein N7522_008519 [Penicillium canescens]KAJ6044323.1 hypothetical protein N7460_005678 [Penicillium canescens]KAJ6055791.1 hypothetical protein N7444_004889 [Penicillium canescens]KAJ6074741.1 hypothetical protein N7446_002518 [Penicillium canescens]KAJ6081954.1 hypothetical protein N7499_006828 [Penicillium canescens]